MALEEKKGKAMEKWLSEKIPTYYIMIADNYKSDCPFIEKYLPKKAF
jgi:peptidyl-prolyl cis-trans isomerase SurA